MIERHFTVTDPQMPAAPAWAEVIEAYSSPGDVVLVPFANDATIARAALERNRRVILLVRTPAQHLRLWGELAPPDDIDRRRALSRLAATTKRDTPLDQHLNRLYRTTCPECGEPVPAMAFVWDTAHQTPAEKELRCEACGFQGRAPVTREDVQRAASIERRGLSYWFILEWLVDVQDTLGREIAQRFLDRYSSRNLSALADITRKIDAELSDDPSSQRILRLLLLHALDGGRQQPLSKADPRPIERNIWHLLTHAPQAEPIDAPVRLTSDLDTFFSESEPAPNIALVAGPARRLARRLPPASIQLILGAPPTLEADAWTWEQLWSRWIFGRGSASGLQPPIGGWVRHTRALSTTIATLMPALHVGGRLIFCFQDDDPDRAAALLIALAPHASLEAFIYQPGVVEPAHLFAATGGAYHMTFVPLSDTPPRPTLDPPALAEAIESTAVEAARDVIHARAEPLPYGWIFVAALVRLAQSGLLHQTMASLDAAISPLAFVKQHVRQALRAALAEGRLAPAAGDSPTHWWLPEPPPAEPLAERVEQAIIDLLQSRPTVAPAEIYYRFAGWLTPEPELVEALFSAYGEEISPGIWRRRSGEEAVPEALLNALRKLGRQLGFSVGTGIADLVWGEGGRATHAFRVPRTGRWSELRGNELPEGVAGYVVLLDSLVNLLRVKLARNPLLQRELIERGWTPVKARHIMALADQAEVDRQDFKKIVGLDPIIEQAEAQMPLF